MKNNIKLKLLLSLFIVVLAFSIVGINYVAAAIAKTTKTTGDTKKTEFKFIASDVYVYNQDVTVDTIIDGNVFAAGNTVTISGEVIGNVFAAGNTVTITDKANIHGSIFVFAQSFAMNGVCYDVYSAAQDVKIGKTAVITRDVKSFANTITLDGKIKRDACISVSQFNFDSKSSKLIAGNLEYTSDSEVADINKIVTGNVKYTAPDTNEGPGVMDYVKDIISTLLYSLVIVLLALWIAPNFTEKATKLLKKKSVFSFVMGIVSTCLIVVLSLVLLILSQGLLAPVSVVAVAITIIALTMSKTVFSMAVAKLIGAKINQDTKPMFIAMTLLVVLVMSLIGFIPGLGSLVLAITNMIGFGIILLNLFYKKDLDADKTEKVTE